MKELTTLRNIIPLELVDKALREIHLDLFEKGISRREIDWWTKQACWFPHLRFSSPILAIRDALPDDLKTGEMCEPQILLTVPETFIGSLDYHIDEEPPWANGRKYLRIVGVPLTSYTHENGGIVIKTSEGIVNPELNAGDVFVMRPDVPHTRGINRSGNIRYSLYFRWIEAGT